jgi:hypothetical protein
MCDYSLHHVANRPAKIEDRLVATKFHNSITRGFAAVGEPSVAVWVSATIYKPRGVETLKYGVLLGNLPNCKPPVVPVLFVLNPSDTYPYARSVRKRGLAKLRLDGGPLRSCNTRAGRQLQHCRALAIAQARD